MIERKDLLAFNFYKKEKFTGSFCGMRYLIGKEQNDGVDLFAVFTWRGPYGFAATTEEKEKKLFAFTEESLEEITAYLNQVYEKNFSSLPSAPSVL